MLNNCIYICVAARIYRYNCLAVTYVNFRQNSELFFIIPKVLKFKYHNVSFLDGFIQLEISTKLCDIPGRSCNVHDPVIRHINNYSCRRFISSHSSLRTSSKTSMRTSRIDRCERRMLSRNFHQLWYSSLHSHGHITSGDVRKPITELRIFSVSAFFFLTVMISGRPGY